MSCDSTLDKETINIDLNEKSIDIKENETEISEINENSIDLNHNKSEINENSIDLNHNKSEINEIIKIDEKTVTDYLEKLWGCEKDNERILNKINEDKNTNKEALEKFKINIEEKFDKIKSVANFTYTNQLEKEVKLNKNDLNNKDIKLSYLAFKDLMSHNQIGDNVMNQINKVYLSLHVKDETKDKLNISNYRFIQIHSKSLKLIDRLWSLRVMNLIKTLDTTIFKSNLIRNITDSILVTANNNTLSRENVVLIDIEKAFDSCDYDAVEFLLNKSLSRKINSKLSENLTKQYMYVIRQRVIYYKNAKVNFKKGIPTGMPSSNIVFSLLMDGIIDEWLTENTNKFKINDDFILNVYVDDIYLKIINLDLKELVINSLIDKIKKYKFNINLQKCKADENLKLNNFSKLEEHDLYLGIPFTRDVKKFTDLTLNQYNVKNKTSLTWNDIHEKLEKINIDSKKINGFFNYKLYPLKKEGNLMDFIKKIA